MRIALRPSGGRGDYELAGSYNHLHASDLLEKLQSFQISPALTIDGKARAHSLAGKPRIRPEGVGRHAYVFICALLLLPPPRRELANTPDAPPQLRATEYTIAGIDVDVVANAPNAVTFAPTAVWARTRGGLLKVDFAERMAVVTALWNAASSGSALVSALISQHMASVETGEHVQIISSASAIQKHYGTKDDVLPFLLKEFGLDGNAGLVLTGVSGLTAGFESEDTVRTLEESRRERTRKWRKQVERGPRAREFSLQVRQAYDYRCLFSGERFPKLPIFDSAGVDGAHILPWSAHQLNAVANGICLCKRCHWAFDNGLLHLDFDAAANAYVLSIPGEVEALAKTSNFDLQPFHASVGKIDAARLPSNKKLWPSPKYIQELNNSG